mmetsp:Transcript_5290/g.11768  ORF Transcript_5290/g.11768 Transcript_5290/m.11768 type:complete len:206 (+) Transcript_5290:41-658(+)
MPNQSSTKDKPPPLKPQPLSVHQFWQQRVEAEEKTRTVTNRYVARALSMKSRGHVNEGPIDMSATSSSYGSSAQDWDRFAKGYPNAFNNNSRGFRELLAQQDCCLEQDFGQTMGRGALGEALSSHGTQQVVEIKAHPLSLPHFFDMRLVPRVRRTRNVPWGPAHNYSSPSEIDTSPLPGLSPRLGTPRGGVLTPRRQPKLGVRLA